MSDLVSLDPSLDSLLAVLPEELVQQLVEAHGVMQTANLATQATQRAMAENQTHAFFTAVPTLDAAARMVAAAPSVTPAQLGRFGQMQDEYLARVEEALAAGNKALVAQLQQVLAAARRDGTG